MALHVHHAPHPLSRFALEHPYAPDWLLLTAVTLAALLLWFGNS